MTARPRVGLSRCLLGDAVRHDGTGRRNDLLLRALSGDVEWVPICPEVEVGMGTPREPIQLTMRSGSVTRAGARVGLVGVRSGDDWTDRMHAWARARVQELLALGLSGYVFKARSPSCGIRDVPVFGAETGRVGQGLFAQALVEALPDLPVADEDELARETGAEVFLARVRAYRCGSNS